MSNNPYQEQITHGEELYQQGQIDEALQVFEEVLENDPENVEALNDLAVISTQNEEFENAAEHLLSAFKVNPDHPDVVSNIESLLEHAKIRQYFGTYVQELQRKQKVSSNDRKILSYLTRILNITTDFQAAVVNLDISPNVKNGEPVLLQGFAGAPRQANSALTPLQMQVLLLEDKNYNHSLIVSADLFGFDAEIVKQIRGLLRPWGIPPEAIMLNASHTHYAPGTVSNVPEILGPFYKSYASAIINAIVQSLESLYSSLEPCFIYAGQTNAKIGVNRRLEKDNQVVFGVNANGYYEEHTPFLLVDFIKNSKSLVLVNHGCHPTGYNVLDQISADYPIYMREFLKKSPEIDEVMFLQGAAGTSKEAIGQNGSTKFTSSPGEVALNGQQLASAIQDALSKDLSCVTGYISGAIQNTMLSLENVPTKNEIEDFLSSDSQNVLVKAWAQYLTQNSDKLIDEISLEVQQFKLGENVVFVTLPGEPVAELGQKILERYSEDSIPFILGYTNGLTAYLPTAKQVTEGGYESDTSKYAYNLPGSFTEDVEDQILTTVESLISTTSQSSDNRKSIKKAGKAFFTLSSGRCGTKTLSHLLNTATNARVYHHPQPYLINETLQAYQNNINKSQTFWRARKSVIQSAWEDDLIFGELDHNMTPFVPAIAEEIPDAKFIVLVRNPWDFVRSGMRRNYYNGHPWDSGRLRPEPSHSDFERWQSMSQFKKVCWLWNETYTRIQSYLEEIPEDRYKIVKFEELVKDPKVTKEVFEFLELDGFDKSRITSILTTPMNKQTAGDFPKAEEWDVDLVSTLKSICFETIQYFKYNKFPNEQNKLISNSEKNVQTEFEIPILGNFIITGDRSFEFLFKNNSIKISVTDFGFSSEEYPYLKWNGEIVFYGLKNAKLNSNLLSNIPHELLEYIPSSIIGIVIDILERFYKSKQHYFYHYSPGDTVVELGAYLGYYSLYMANKVGSSGRILAVECMPEQFKVLQKNLNENFPTSAEVENVGVWNTNGTKQVFTGGNQLNGFREDIIEQFASDIKSVEIPVATIDTILTRHNVAQVDLLILQLNGNELDALKGLDLEKFSIKNFAIAANYTIDNEPAIKTLSGYLRDNGYEIFTANNWVYGRKSKIRITQIESIKRPIFIGGCGRSGTTLLRVMLDSHRNIACGPESELLIKEKFDIGELSFKFDLPHGVVQYLAKQSANRIDFINRFFTLFAKERNKSRWAEKTPRNVYALDSIFNYFPKGKFVHVIRDGRDVVNSLRTHPRFHVVNGERKSTNIFHPLEPCIDRWLNDVQEGLKGRNYEGYYEVYYEDLVSNPEKTLRNLLEFLGEPWDPNVLTFYQDKKSSRNILKFPQNAEATKPVSAKRINRWTKDFSLEDALFFEKKAGDLLRELGYVEDSLWLSQLK